MYVGFRDKQVKLAPDLSAGGGGVPASIYYYSTLDILTIVFSGRCNVKYLPIFDALVI